MRTIERTGQFERDYRREAKGRHARTLAADFQELLIALATDAPLATRQRDHELIGDWKDHRDAM